MQSLTEESRGFFEDLLKYSKRKHNGYWVFQPRTKRFGNIKYKEHRILMQLHLNVLLDPHELVHHKDGNKLNNSIENLEIVTAERHNSDHHAGSRNFGIFRPHNKLSESVIKRIRELAEKNIKSDGSPNCSKIGDLVGVSGVTVSRYLCFKDFS